ncbi:Metal tolerance protein 9 [Sphaceloma murrayae]|uniref:Metal tolerance protein 9 n=1 Tax=Sphaceloma murrayae TaxID=2082308 RepID=A0A2K1QG81_9PEZI|nr:Metal tolerance protein 9 [Sphaceloma murrayae]
MVGRRHSERSFERKNSSKSQDKKHETNGRGPADDLERGNAGSKQNLKPRPNLFRFKDAANTALEDSRREELKKQILNGVDHKQLERFRKSDADLKSIENKAVREFYEQQNERINDWLEVDTLVMALADDVLDSMDPDHDGDGVRERQGGLQTQSGNIWDFLPEEEKEKRAEGEKKARWAININVLANIILLIAKIGAASSSNSLSLIASLLDSALDLLCTVIVWTTNRLVQWRLSALNKRFPVGRRRLEPLGILVFSIIMVISFAQILQESAQKLMKMEGEAAELPLVAIGAMGGTVIVKGIIWIGCAKIKTTQVQALAQDCKTDVYFNTLSLLFPFIGAKTGTWWLDPVGAAFLSLFIIYDWSSTCFENVTRLSGQAADDRLQKKLMYMAYRFSPVVEGFKSVTAYHAGDGVWVEVDCLMDENTRLYRSHDVAETLQYCCEGLGEVDRAFVSTDYTSQGPTGHANDAERT